MIENQDMQAQKFTKLLEEAIRQANLEVIKPMVPVISIDGILPVAISVAKLRGKYLAATMDLLGKDAGSLPNADQIDKLRTLRVAYEEAVTAYQTMEHAIQKGYLELSLG